MQKLLIEDLEQISLMSGTYKYTKHFLESWVEWAVEDDNNPPFVDKYFQGYNGRRRTHMLKLCMIVAASSRNDLVLTKNDLDRAKMLLLEVEQKMGNVFKGIGRSDISNTIYEFTRYIEMSRKNEIPVFEIARQFEGSLDKFTMDRVIASIEMTGRIRLLKRPASQGGDMIIRI